MRLIFLDISTKFLIAETRIKIGQSTNHLNVLAPH